TPVSLRTIFRRRTEPRLPRSADRGRGRLPPAASSGPLRFRVYLPLVFPFDPLALPAQHRGRVLHLNPGSNRPSRTDSASASVPAWAAALTTFFSQSVQHSQQL